jgi:hypothetical protein
MLAHMQAWQDKLFKNNERAEMVLYENKNVLTPTALKEVCNTIFGQLDHYSQMLELHNKIMEISINLKTFNDICTRCWQIDSFRLIILTQNFHNGHLPDEETAAATGSGFIIKQHIYFFRLKVMPRTTMQIYGKITSIKTVQRKEILSQKQIPSKGSTSASMVSRRRRRLMAAPERTCPATSTATS